MPSTYGGIGEKQFGDPNIMKLKESNKVRPLDNTVAGWRQHGIEHPSDPEQFVSVVCPGPRSCPLCRKPVSAEGKDHFPVSRRYAANAWDYESGSVKVLVAGPAVYNPFKEAAQVGIDPSNCDWTIIKSGTGIKTDYTVVRHDATPFTAKTITPDMLHNVDKYEQPESTEKIFEILEKFGIDYDALSSPSYTLEEALAFKMPYTKHKGLTIEQLVSQDQEYAEWMHGAKLEQGQLGDPVFLAIQVVLEDRGVVPSLEEALLNLPDEEPPQAAEPAAQPDPRDQPMPQAKADPQAAAAANLVLLVGPDGSESAVPASVVEPMLAAGFTRKAPPEPEPQPSTSRVLINGQEIELPTDTAAGLIAAGTATLVEAVPAVPDPEPPKLPLPDEFVAVSIGGATVPMPFVQADMVVSTTPGASFVDPLVGAAYERSKAAEEAAAASSPSVTGTSGTDSTADDPERPHRCDECDKAFKTPGALTQHKNREHKAAEPKPSAVPATNGTGDADEVVTRVKQKVATAPFARDYQKLLAIFEEETGEKNFVDMNSEQVAKLEKRIDKEIAAATAA